MNSSEVVNIEVARIRRNLRNMRQRELPRHPMPLGNTKYRRVPVDECGRLFCGRCAIYHDGYCRTTYSVQRGGWCDAHNYHHERHETGVRS